MDDMKKLIERYKKELMDMSRSRPAPAPEPQAEKKRTPQVIGYVDEGAQLDEIFSRLAENPPAVSTEPVPEEQAAAEQFPTKPVSEEIFGVDKQTEEMNKEVAEQPKTPVSEEREIRVPEMNERGVNEREMNEPENPSAIADGYPTRQAKEPDDEITDNPRFTEPRFTEIPSFQQTREDITNESVPENNAPASNASGVTDNSPTTPRADFAYGGTVSEERAEGLNRQPISGTEYGEQLTGRSFPDERTPENSREDIVREGSQTEPGNYPEPVYADFADFERKNTGRGTMSFRVYTAREALPVIGAKVIITKQIGGEMHTFSVLTTDMSGQTAPITLPAPEKNLSLDSGNKIQPFSLYDAIVTKNGYAAIRYTGIPVFDGVNSVQRAAMVPTEEQMAENITEVSENA